MGYSHNISTVFKRDELLRPLFRFPAEHVWYTSFEDAPVKAQQIRECFYIARRKRKELPQLFQLSQLYSIHVRGDKVIARKKDLYMPPLPETGSTVFDAPEEAAPEVIRVESARSSAEVIQRWLEHQPTSLPYYFAHVTLSHEDKAEVERWSANLEPAWTLTWHNSSLRIDPAS